MFKQILRCSTVGVASALLSLSVQSASITQIGDNVSFTYDDSSFYGTGFVVGDSIFFNPTAISAQSENTTGAVVVSEALNIDVKVLEGVDYVIDSIQIAESGDYLLQGGDSSASVSGLLQVTSQTTFCGGVTVVCQDEDQLDAGPLNVVGATTLWNAAASVDLGDTAGWGSDTKVRAQIQNILTATSTVDGEFAFVQKKFNGVGVHVSNVPLPAAAWLFGSALLGLGVAKRQKV